MPIIYDTKIKIYKYSDRVQIREYESSLISNFEKSDITKEKRGIILDKLVTLRQMESVYGFKGLLYEKEIKPQLVREPKKRISKPDEFKKIDKRNLTRTITSMIDYTENYKDEWKSFITLTFAENVTSIDQANHEFSLWTKRYTRHCKKLGHELMYLGVAEFQKRGAVHYHLLLNVPCGTSLLPYQYEPYWSEDESRVLMRIKKAYDKKPNKHGVKMLRPCYDVPCWNGGFSGALNFEEVDCDFNPVAYMCKYMCKDIDDRLWGRKKILKSNNVKPPLIIKALNDGRINELLDYLFKLGYISTPYEFKGLSDKPYCKPFKNEDLQITTPVNREVTKGIIHDILGLGRAFSDMSLPF